VQDAAAAVPARTLGAVAGREVLDLCAAPGGKTLQLAAAGARVTALDVSAPRLRRLTENLARTGLSAEVITADALAWSPGRAFAAILLDAPCSATGTIRRHPDLPFVRGADDLPGLTALQAQLLARAWDWLAPGGRLVFCTCSLMPEEGEGQLSRFRALHPEAEVVAPGAGVAGIEAGWIDGAGGLRLRPDFWAERGGMDGFYAMALTKPGIAA
jgi:16S rRNA (cytosine967-C5)-methyltransferase